MTAEQQALANALQALSFGKQAEQEQTILRYANCVALQPLNTAAEQWTGRRVFGLRLNTAHNLTIHEEIKPSWTDRLTRQQTFY